MDAYNLSITSGPVIFRTRHFYKGEIYKVKTHYDTMIRMINDYDYIFGQNEPVKYDRAYFEKTMANLSLEHNEDELLYVLELNVSHYA